jgi:nitrite reductase/ring-hydroxylating ferredoxin subunit/Fe-S cluster biogenesis protein NfuA
MNVVDTTPTRRNDLAEFLSDVERLESIFATWEETPRNAVAAYRTAIETLHGEALTRLVRALKEDPAALAAMKAAIGDEIVYAVLRRHGILKASVAERVEVALASIRPMLASHGGDVELVKISPPTIEVRFIGACDGCPASQLTFHAGVKKAVEDACPEITDVLQVKGSGGVNENAVHFVSPFPNAAADHWVDAGTLNAIPEGGVLSVLVGGEKLLLSRRGTMVTCFQNACAHLGFPLHDGDVEDGIITCPHHGFRYDLSSGECLTAPEVQLQPHAVRVTGSKVEVRLAG